MTGFFALNPDERQLHVDHATDAVRGLAAQMMTDAATRKVDPRSALEYRSYKTCRLDCVVAVKHPSRSSCLELSRDGGWPRAYVGSAKVLLQAESQEPFVLFLISKDLSRWIMKRQGVNLLGSPPDELVGDFTSAERATWKDLVKTARHINCKIASANRRQASGTRNSFA